MSATPYPLCWPYSIPRQKHREIGQFRTTLSGAMNNVKQSLHLFAKDSGKPITRLVISSMVTLGAERPTDPGVAVWFEWDGLGVCIPVDRYMTVEANLQAIHHIIEARRTEMRHGTLALVRASFQGFQALPSPSGSKRHWTVVFGLHETASAAEIEAAYRAKAKFAHPDTTGGSHAAMSALNVARDEALKERHP